MPPVIIQVPESLTLWTVYPFCAALQKQRPADEVIFDFRKTKTVEPFGMLVIASEIERCVASHPSTKFMCRNHEEMTYAAHMGFFQAFGADFGRLPGAASGGRSYIPLTYFEISALQRRAAAAGHDVGDEVEAQSKRLAETLCTCDDGDVFDTLAYSIREIMRNVAEHAQTEDLSICAQYWPTKGRAEVAILDRGIGLRKSLSNNPLIDTSTNKQAINFALMPAVSGKVFRGSRSSRDRGPWANSGFGLYMTSRICRNGGNFFIASGDTGMLLTTGKGGKRYVDTCLSGTAVRLSIQTKNLASLRDTLAKYRDEGFEIQKKYEEIVSIDPSSASLMLSQDFDMNLWDKLLLKLKS
jgi:hypothetical protein